MFQWIISFLSAPIFNTLLKGWQAKLDSQTAAGVQAADVAKKAMETEVLQRQANASIVVATLGNSWTAIPMVLVMGAAALYFVKCVFYDTILGWGTTEKLGGDIQLTYNLVMSFWFGSAALRGTVATIRGLWR
jgi:hypothetical protein